MRDRPFPDLWTFSVVCLCREGQGFITVADLRSALSEETKPEVIDRIMQEVNIKKVRTHFSQHALPHSCHLLLVLSLQSIPYAVLRKAGLCRVRHKNGMASPAVLLRDG